MYEYANMFRKPLLSFQKAQFYTINFNAEIFPLHKAIAAH
jgi:hypothetical protein